MAQNNEDHGGDKDKRGFAGMSEEERKRIASKGGKAAHESGNANKFDSESGREAGRKGGQAGGQNSTTNTTPEEGMM